MFVLRHVAGVASALVLAAAAASVAPAQAHENSWTGLYFGGGVGWMDGSSDWRFPDATATSTQSASFDWDSAVLSGHLGYQHQIGSIVVGVELGAARHIDSFDRQEAACAFPAPFTDRCDLKNVGSLLTAGGRLGWTPSSQWLFYVSGGYAQAHVDSQIRFGGVGVPPAPNATPVTSSSVRQNGWYLGGGVDFALTRNVLLGVEYKRIELDDEGHCVGGVCSSPSILNRNVDLSVDLVQARISYKFGN